MASKIQLKKSNVTGRIPDPADLDWGEIALNYLDGKLFYKQHGTGTVQVLNTDTDTITRLRGTASGTYASGDLTLLAGTNVSIAQSGTDITISANAAAEDPTKLPLTGGTMTGAINMSGTQTISAGGYAGIEYYNQAGGQWQGYIGTESNSGNLRFNSYNGNHNWYSNSNSIATLNSTRLRLGAPAGNPAPAIVSNLNRYLEIAVNDANATSYPYGSGVVFHHGGVSTSALSYIQPDANAGYFYFNSDDSAFAGTTSASSLRAPIFYDSADAAYYLDPASGANGISLNVQGRIQVGTFNNSQENTGEAWIGRASDRGVGTLTVQLGNDAARYFEVVDKDWTTVIFGVGMNTFGYKGNAVLHAGNYNSYSPTLTGTGASGTWSISITGSSSSASDLVDNSSWLKARGSVNEADLDTATANGYYSVSKTGHSSSLLSWNAAGSTGPVQIDVSYYEEIRYRSKTDSATWNNWKTILHTDNYNSYALPLTGGTLTGALTINADDGLKAIYGGTDGQTWYRGWGMESDRGAVYIRGTGNASQTLRIGYSEGSQSWNTVRVDASTFTHNGNTVWTAGNDGSGSGLDADLLDGIDSSGYWTKSGGWWGSNFAGSRLQGVSANGGEFVLIQDHPNANQISVLVDGAYIAGENNGFWMTPGNDWNTRYGFYWNGSQIDFRQGTAPVVFGGFVGIGNSFGSDDGSWGSRLNVGGAPHARIDVRCADDGIVTTMYSHVGQNAGKIGTMSNHRLELMANGGTKAAILTNGNVGIGTITPSEKLHVTDGTVRVDGSTDGIRVFKDGSASMHSHVYLANAANSIAYNFQLNADGSALNLYTYGGSSWENRYTFTAAGSLGIGTTNPALGSGGAPGLNIVNNIHTQLRVQSSSSSAGIEFSPSSGNSWEFQATNSNTFILYDRSQSVYRWTIASTGNMSIGYNNDNDNGYKLAVNGSFAATTKSFVIDHPTKPGKKLRYGSLEGPENGVYVRGRSSTTVIELPDYWTGLVDPDSITVQLTAIGSAGHVWVESIEDNKVYIKFKSCKSYFYFIQAERKDVEKLVVEF